MNRIIVILKKLFPELALRMENLARVQRTWGSIVGERLARYSVPYDLKDKTLYISARTQHAAHILNSMRGNIKRALLQQNQRIRRGSRGSDESGESDELEIKITQGIPSEYNNKSYNNESKKNKTNSIGIASVKGIKISDEEVNEVKRDFDFPLELDTETSQALAHLIVFFGKRFGK